MLKRPKANKNVKELDRLKRIGFIYEKICDIENIKLAIMKSSLGKRDERRVKVVLDDLEKHARIIQRMLVNKTYKPSSPIVKEIRDGVNKKNRVIHKPRYFPDQVIQWALMLQIEPIMMRGMYKYTAGSVPKRGTSFGKKTIRKWVDNDKRNTKYCLQMDIKKFYPSVNGDILKNMFRRVIKDEDCLWLINSIIESEEGLPIGFYTSQWFSNFFLQGLDHYIKQKLKVKYYIRYVDDLVLMGPNKKKLHAVKRKVEAFLSKIDLELKSNWQVFRTDVRAIDFLGFRFFRNKTILRKRNSLRIKRRVKKIGKKNYLNYRDACAVISYWGWIKNTNSFYFYQKYVKPHVSVKASRKAVSYHAKIRNNRR